MGRREGEGGRERGRERGSEGWGGREGGRKGWIWPVLLLCRILSISHASLYTAVVSYEYCCALNRNTTPLCSIHACYTVI